MRILLAEDNVDNREMLSRRLIRKGFDVFVAENGLQAVEMADTVKPDLILMDISMPIMSGIEATLKIRETRSHGDLPIIALTAHAMDSDRKQCMEAGCTDFATKPVNFKELMQQIETAASKENNDALSALHA
ncbi:MAG: response regulator [Pseudomonadota bacterium]